ncbi:Multidrug resistance protein B [Sphingobacterium thalpophilum]|uniref:Multidrug resistance protein B n=1 Tax=Sphingobacterium thalpophilum TaxID=259 RepID=A0A4U9U623_9SPHI|nr:Multidrug resistance protein B [Sphingobacterium thalpophilum]
MSTLPNNNAVDNILPIFKSWVPEWMIKIVLFALLLPSIVLFFLPITNLQAAAGYYGSEPADMQFSVALFYAGYVGFYSLERRFFNYLAAREYFILFTFLLLLTCWICYLTKEIYIFFPIRFVQGLLFASTVNLSLSLMFTRLRSERAREISFSVFFGLLICALPFNNIVTADLIDSFNFNIVYKGALFSYLPSLIFLPMTMNRIRLNIRFPLYKLDWQSFSLYSIGLVLIGYIMIFGQEYYWFTDIRIRCSMLALTVLTVLFIIRQRAMKRPYIDLRIFRSRNFKAGLLVLFIMYICRFVSGITNSYFSSLLGFDPMHISYINVFNLMGLISGTIVAACMIIQKKNIRYIWSIGFILLLVFHIIMFYHSDVQADEYNYFIPLYLQGLGVGLIMVPTIIYTISAVAVSRGTSAAAISLAIRYLGFCASIALINFFDLYGKSRHYNAFQDHLSLLDYPLIRYMQTQTNVLLTKGLHSGLSGKATEKLLTATVHKQDQLRFAMDYYELIAWLIVGILLLISLSPYLSKTIVRLRSKRLAPA